MEFFLGFLFALATVTVVRAIFIRSNLDKYSIRPILHTQSYIHSLISQSVAHQLMPPEPLKTQARALLDKNSLRVVFADNTAYWIKDNQFFQARVINGQIDNSTTKVVDTMGMDKVELDKMFFIVQKLTEGKKNDDRDSGFKDL